MVGLEPRAYGAHRLKRTKGTLIYKKTGPATADGSKPNLCADSMPLRAIG